MTANTQGWNLRQWCRYKLLRTLLKNKTNKIQIQNWERNINTITQHYKDPKTFWSKIKQLKENKKPTNQYLIKNNVKLMQEDEKEGAFWEIWKEVFKISQEENRAYDRENEEEVEEYLTRNEDKLTKLKREKITCSQWERRVAAVNTSGPSPSDPYQAHRSRWWRSTLPTGTEWGGPTLAPRSTPYTRGTRSTSHRSLWKRSWSFVWLWRTSGLLGLMSICLPGPGQLRYKEVYYI